MYNRKKTLKSQVVADELRKKIYAELFPGNCLPRKCDLVNFFQVSQKTIENALNILRAEGLIRGVRGSGIFVDKATHPSDINLTHRLVMVVMPLIGHHFESFYRKLRRILIQDNLYPVSYDMDESLSCLAHISTFLSAPIQGVLYHGDSYWNNPFLDNWKNLKSVALEEFDAEGIPPDCAVLTDFEAGAYEIARNFIACGRRELAFVSHEPLLTMPTSPVFWKRHVTTQFRNGIEKAIRENGKGNLDSYSIDLANKKEDLKDVAAKGYDGIICSSDVLAYWTRIKALETGRRCPEDFFLSGCYNTPWSGNTDFPISTLDLNSDLMSEIAMRLLKSESREIVKVKPSLICRKSMQLYS